MLEQNACISKISDVGPLCIKSHCIINKLHGCFPLVKREKGESLIFIIFMKKNLLLHCILDLNIYTCSWVSQYSKKIKGKDCIISNTPHQAGAYMSYAPSLLQMYLILGHLRDLIKMSAS